MNEAKILRPNFEEKVKTAEAEIADFEKVVKGGSGGDNGGMDRLANLERRVDSIDSKLDRVDTRLGGLETQFEGVRVQMTSVEKAIVGLDAKLDISGIRASVEKAHTDIYKWIATLVIGVVSVTAAIYFGIQHLPH